MNEKVRKRNKDRMEVGILDFLMRSPKKDFSVAEIKKGIGLGMSQTNYFLNELKKHINEGRPYAKAYSYKMQKNPMTNLDQIFFRYNGN